MFRPERIYKIMNPKKLAFIIFCIVSCGTVISAQGLPAANQWIPKDAVIVLEVAQPKVIIEQVAGEKAIGALNAMPVFQQVQSQPKFREFVNLINFMEITLETNWRDGLGALTGGGITLAVCPEDTVVLIVDAEDGEMLGKLHEMLLNIARSEAEKQGREGIVASTEYDGVTAWTFDGKEAHAIIGKRLVLSNKPEGLKVVLEHRAGVEQTSLESSQEYRAARRAAGADVAARAFVNLKPLMQLPGLAGVLEQQKTNPIAGLVFSGIIEAMRNSNWLSMGLKAEGDSIVLQASVDGIPDAGGVAGFALPRTKGEGVQKSFNVPRRLGAIGLYRDLHKFYAAKDELFPERTSGLIFFENMMGIFFSGRDLTDEIMAQTRPEIQLIVAEQEYDKEIGTPLVKLPAFAVVFHLREPEKFRMVAEEAWQKAVGLINFTRGQQAMQGLIIERPKQGETTFTMAYFSSADAEDRMRLDQRFNFRPAIAMPGEYLVLSSTDGLARDLIDAIEGQESVESLDGIHSALEIDAGQLSSILQSNRETLVRGDMVKKGKTQEEAENGIDMFIMLTKFVKRLKLNIGTSEGLTQGVLELKLNLQ